LRSGVESRPGRKGVGGLLVTAIGILSSLTIFAVHFDVEPVEEWLNPALYEAVPFTATHSGQWPVADVTFNRRVNFVRFSGNNTNSGTQVCYDRIIPVMMPGEAATTACNLAGFAVSGLKVEYADIVIQTRFRLRYIPFVRWPLLGPDQRRFVTVAAEDKSLRWIHQPASEKLGQ
jgi:hypothetical protein